SVSDPLMHWETQCQGGLYLAKMALDFLLVPATSTDTERAFSGGGLTVSWMCHSLSDQLTWAATVLASWAAVEGMVPEEDIIQRFCDKKKRVRNVQKEPVTADVIEIS
ncbi:hypothetical protein K439DRAFT_1343269, partial [Ramaria rubella]